MELRHLVAYGAAVLAAVAFSASAQQQTEKPKEMQQSQQPGSGQAMSPELVRKVQQALNEKGFDAGPVDGLWGPLTHRGVQNFQRSQSGLEATGRLNAKTLSALGIEAGGDAAAGATGEARKERTGEQDRKQ